MTATPVSEVGLLRLAALGVVGAVRARTPGPADAVRSLLAAQGQDLPGVLAAIALRTADGAREGAETEADTAAGTGADAVRAAFDTGAIVRSWPMRGTLHVVAAEDLAPLLPLGTPRALTAAAQRRPGLGLPDDALDRAGEVASTALAGGGRLTRAELTAAWTEAGVVTTSAQGNHLLRTLGMTGLLVLGPFAGPKEQQVVLRGTWTPAAGAPDRDAALADLARRYLTGHGPATVADLARWADLPLRDARAGVAAVRGDLAATEIDGVEHLMDPATPDRLADARADAEAEHLLPAFDEFVLGYADRSAVLDPAHADRIVPGGNGMFRPTVVVGGRVVGTWAIRGSGRNRRVERVPFT